MVPGTRALTLVDHPSPTDNCTRLRRPSRWSAAIRTWPSRTTFAYRGVALTDSKRGHDPGDDDAEDAVAAAAEVVAVGGGGGKGVKSSRLVFDLRPWNLSIPYGRFDRDNPSLPPTFDFAFLRRALLLLLFASRQQVLLKALQLLYVLENGIYTNQRYQTVIRSWALGEAGMITGLSFAPCGSGQHGCWRHRLRWQDFWQWRQRGTWTCYDGLTQRGSWQQGLCRHCLRWQES